jgi:hypothetical protein
MDVVNCKKCKRSLGQIDNGIIVAGQVLRVYGRVRVSCNFCGHPFTYVETLPPDTGHPKGALEIINSLGKDYSESWLYQKELKRRKAIESK